MSRPPTLLSPAQGAAFTMGRALLLFDAWSSVDDGPLELDRAILIDFVLQNPRLFVALITDLDPVLRGYDLQEAGISDMFAHRRLETARERFQVTTSGLVARDLIREEAAPTTSDSAVFRVTEIGSAVASGFTTQLAHATRALSVVVCSNWRRRNHRELQRLIRASLPDQSSQAARLTRPFAEWLLDTE